MCIRDRFKGIVVALKANFLIVEIGYKNFKHDLLDQLYEKTRLLCTRRSKLDYQGLFIDVGDVVCVESVDYKNKKAVISEVEPRQSFLKRPAVANVTLVSICISCLLYTSPSPRDVEESRMPSSA